MSTLQLLTSGEAAERLRMLRSRVVRLARAGVIPHVALPDGEIRFDADELDAWVSRHRQLPAPPEDCTDGE